MSTKKVTPSKQTALKKSVTRDEINVVKNGAILNVLVPFTMGYSIPPLPPILPAYWSFQRDKVLRSTVHQEAMWASAIGIAISKACAMGWELQGEMPNLISRLQDIFIEADGAMNGWINYLAKDLRDYLTTDNGSFTEIIRETSAYYSRVVGIRHLDSQRCLRTGDPDKPVIYMDKLGKWHELAAHQVIAMSELPDPSEEYFGVGVCAASRAYKAIYKLAAIENYLCDKVTGLRPLAIYVVNGILDTQLKGAIESAKNSEVAKGVANYMGALVVGVPSETPPELVTIPLAELPDRFDRKQEFDLSILTYADALGLDIQDIQPLSGGSLGTSAQSQTLDEKARGKGMASWKVDKVHMINQFILPEAITFVFTEKDYRDLSNQTALQKQHIEVSKLRIDAGVTTREQERQLLVDWNDLPKEFLKVDLTQQSTLADDEKKTDADAAGENSDAMTEMPEKPEETQEANEKPTATTEPEEKPEDDEESDNGKKPKKAKKSAHEVMASTAGQRAALEFMRLVLPEAQMNYARMRNQEIENGITEEGLPEQIPGQAND